MNYKCLTCGYVVTLADNRVCCRKPVMVPVEENTDKYIGALKDLYNTEDIKCQQSVDK